MNINSLFEKNKDISKNDMDIDKETENIPYLDSLNVRNKIFRFNITKKKENLDNSISKEPLKMDQVARKKYKELKFQQKKQLKDEKIKKFLEEGENVYELYSVMIHSGSA